MTDWFLELSSLDRGFAVSTLLGALLFFLRVTLMLVGGDDAGDAGDLDAPDDFELDHADAADSSFRILSLQGLMAFFLIFGLTGLTLTQEVGAHAVVAFFVAFAAGVAAMFVIGLLYLVFQRMQSSGTINLQNAIGQEGEVYLNIPAGGTGQVRVAVQGRLRVEDAMAASGEALPTGTKIAVTDVRGHAVLVVTPAPDAAPNHPPHEKE